MTATEISLVLIASVLFLIFIAIIVAILMAARAYKKRVVPLILKSNGVLDNLSKVTLAAREQIEELKTTVDDISYRTRVMAVNVQEQVLPTVTDVISSLSVVARFFKLFVGSKKQQKSKQ